MVEMVEIVLFSLTYFVSLQAVCGIKKGSKTSKTY